MQKQNAENDALKPGKGGVDKTEKIEQSMEQGGCTFFDRLYVDIVKTYLNTESVKETAARLKISVVKVRKVLITEGLWSSKTSLEIQHYLNKGKTTAEIAAILSTTEKAVQQYLPYTRGTYNGSNVSVAALNSANYRRRIRILQETILKRRKELAMENEWNEIYGETSVDRVDPIRLHLELVSNDFSSKEAEEITRVLRTYGGVSHGETISRDIVVPGNMPLWALNYTIQKCFGWQNSHLHQFQLPESQFEKITDGTVGKYAELVGVVFRSPWMDEGEEVWNDDYESGSFKTWIRRKYTGPYESLCHGEGIWQCKKDLAEWRERYTYVKLEHIITDCDTESYSWLKPITEEAYQKENQTVADFHEEERYGRNIKVRSEVYAFDDIPIGAARFMSERSCTQMLERLTVEEVFAIHDRGLDDKLAKGDRVPDCFDEVMDDEVHDGIEDCLQEDSPILQPMVGCLTDTLYYNYDFGDNWFVKITASFGASDLIDSGRIIQDELEQAVLTVCSKYRPVCIAQDGCFVLDDVGGMSGFVQFLKGINQKSKRKDVGAENDGEDDSDEYGPYADKDESLEWAKSLGWSKRKVSNNNLL